MAKIFERNPDSGEIRSRDFGDQRYLMRYGQPIKRLLMANGMCP